MALVITVNISDEQEVCLLNDLLDIDDWVQKAVEGKINNCKKRMAAQALSVLTSDPDVTTMPANNEDLITCLCSRPDYKNRVARDEEEEATQIK